MSIRLPTLTPAVDRGNTRLHSIEKRNVFERRRSAARSMSLRNSFQWPGPRSILSPVTQPRSMFAGSRLHAHQSLRGSAFDGSPPASACSPAIAVPQRKSRGKSRWAALAGAAATSRARVGVSALSSFTAAPL